MPESSYMIWFNEPKWWKIDDLFASEEWFLLMAELSDLGIELHSIRVTARKGEDLTRHVTLIGMKGKVPCRIRGQGEDVTAAIADATERASIKYGAAPF